MHVLRPRKINLDIVVREPVRLGCRTRGQEDALDDATLKQALDSVDRARQQLKQAEQELKRLERRWKKWTKID